MCTSSSLNDIDASDYCDYQNHYNNYNKTFFASHDSIFEENFSSNSAKMLVRGKEH